jgi:cytochrome c-type biogenesis protein CcmH/NrfF
MFHRTHRAISPARWAKLLLLLVACAFLLGAGDDVNSRFNDLGHKLMCRCGCNQVLLECNHVGCQYSERMRGELMAALQRGDSDDLVLQAFVQKYGTVVLAAPTTTGFNRIAWIMPFVALGLGLTLVVVVVRAWNHRLAAAATPPAATPSELDAYRERARQETEL